MFSLFMYIIYIYLTVLCKIIISSNKLSVLHIIVLTKFQT